MRRIIGPFSRVLLLLVLFVPLVLSAQRRSFSGVYELSNMTQSDEEVQVTVTLLLRNYSGGAIHGGTVLLLNSSPKREVLGKFAPVDDFEEAQKVRISGVFSVPRAEYALWAEGRNPMLRFQFPASSAEGTGSMVGIDLRRSNRINSIAN